MSERISEDRIPLPKSVASGFFIGAVVWLVTLVWGLSQRDSDLSYTTRDVQRIENTVNRLDTEMASIRASAQQQAIQLARIEEHTKNTSEAVLSLSRQLERRYSSESQ